MSRETNICKRCLEPFENYWGKKALYCNDCKVARMEEHERNVYARRKERRKLAAA